MPVLSDILLTKSAFLIAKNYFLITKIHRLAIVGAISKGRKKIRSINRSSRFCCITLQQLISQRIG